MNKDLLRQALNTNAAIRNTYGWVKVKQDAAEAAYDHAMQMYEQWGVDSPVFLQAHDFAKTLKSQADFAVGVCMNLVAENQAVIDQYNAAINATNKQGD